MAGGSASRAQASREGGASTTCKVLFAVVLFSFVGFVALNRHTAKGVLRSAMASFGLQSALPAQPGQPVASPAVAEFPRLPNCGLRAPDESAGSTCAKETWAYYEEHKSQFWGGAGFERAMSAIFNKEDGKQLFPRSRPITIVHVGAHMGSVLDRYAALLRGPRLDDRIIMIEPNPANVQRLTGRIRLDPRLSILHAAAYDKTGEIWFEFGGFPNVLGNGGRVKTEFPANATGDQEEGRGMRLRSVTLDELLADREVIDFIMMDAEGHEPFILQGAVQTLMRTRLMVFGCSDRWKNEIGPSFDPSSPFALLAHSGMFPVLLGEKRNLPLHPDAVLVDAHRNMPTWGFCMAAHTEPAAIANATFLASHIAGPDAAAETTSCYQHVEGRLGKSCKNGRLTNIALA